MDLKERVALVMAVADIWQGTQRESLARHPRICLISASSLSRFANRSFSSIFSQFDTRLAWRRPCRIVYAHAMSTISQFNRDSA
jgi:hypothetical protein